MKIKRKRRPFENRLTFQFPKDSHMFISENIGRFREWEMGSVIFRDKICPPVRAGDAKLPKYVWIEYED